MKVQEIFSLEDFKQTIPFTALGARTCYSSGDLNYLLNDPRVVSKEDRAKFLSKLGNYKHFSVFAHAFAYKDLLSLTEEKINSLLDENLRTLKKTKKAEILALKIAATSFKSHYNPKYPTVIGISLRHYLERVLEENEEEYFKTFEKMADYDVPVEPLGTEKNVTLIGLIKEYDGYAVFFIDDVSRTMTHQLVRHTALNYSQRSQRYVNEDQNKLIIPPSVKETDFGGIPEDIKKNYLQIIYEYSKLITSSEVKDSLKDNVLGRIEEFIQSYRKRKNLTLEDIFILTDELAEAVYDVAVYRGKVKREDARFILPHGRKTTIVVSGTISWIKDFIIKRTDPHAQWEIRDVAIQMKNLLEKQGIDF
ncbi:FAD-dependent thymidylate synthase [Persephonella sp.]